MSPSAGIDIANATVNFGGDAPAVNDVSLAIREGEFFTLLGPSGCGKTTLLRSLAGFVSLSSGAIAIGGRTVDGVPPHKRDTAMVFQSYAIFPHLTVRKNVEYGLKQRGVTGAEARERVATALGMVDLGGYEDRLPRNLSGGQQQRVVIARAIVTRPRVLLMDEPLANLDAKLRVRLRSDVRELQRELGITTVYVTHDQEEALSLSDRIGVMSHGNLLQVGTPEEVYEQPVSMAVARFVGEGTFLRAAPDANGVRLDDGTVLQDVQQTESERLWIGVRPHAMRIVPADSPTARLRGTVTSTTYLGTATRVGVDCGLETPVVVDIPASGVRPTSGDRVGIEMPAAAVMVFPEEPVDVAAVEDVEL